MYYNIFLAGVEVREWLHVSSNDCPYAFSTPLTLRASAVCGKAAHFRVSPGARNQDVHITLRLYVVITSDPKGQGLIVSKWINKCSTHRLLGSTSAKAISDNRERLPPQSIPHLSPNHFCFLYSERRIIVNKFLKNW